MAQQSILSNELNASELKEHIPTEDWMSSLPISLQNIPISKLAIPGTHNSGTFSLSTALAPDIDGFIASLASNPVIGPLVRKIILKWAQCQKLTFTEQLQAGIRYFDLRVAASSCSEDFFLVHSVFGPKLSDLLGALLTFLEAHPYEVVLLDFNHFYAMEAKHRQLINYLISKFGPILCNQCAISDLTLQNMWSHQKQVIIFYQDKAAFGVREMWPVSRILSHWPNTDNPITCRDFLSNCFSKCHTRDFIVCQWVLTPSINTVLKSLLNGGNVRTLRDSLLPLLYQWVEESTHCCAHPPTIIIADYVEDGDLIQIILKLNYKRIVSV